jgi:hypothetical protein
MVAKVCGELTDPKDGAGVECIANEILSDIPDVISHYPSYSADQCKTNCIYTMK